MNAAEIIFLTTVCLSGIFQAHALQCYSCDSSLLEGCGDAFNETAMANYVVNCTTATTVNAAGTLEKLSFHKATTDDYKLYCSTLKASVENVTRTLRQCIAVVKDRYCDYYAAGAAMQGVTVNDCYTCESDRCNPAVRFQVFDGLLLSCAVFSAIVCYLLKY